MKDKATFYYVDVGTGMTFGLHADGENVTWTADKRTRVKTNKQALKYVRQTVEDMHQKLSELRDIERRMKALVAKESAADKPKEPEETT